MSTCFVAGIVKGLIENNDATRHFGSLIGFQSHLAKARACGVVEGDGSDVRVTEKGREWYEQKRMNELPQGRAYLWSLVCKEDWTIPPNTQAERQP